MENLIIFFTILILSYVPVLIYALSRNRSDFRFNVFIRRNRDRFILGFIGSALFVFVLSVISVETVSGLLKPFGLLLDAGASLRGIAATIGIFIGSALVVGMRGDQEKSKK